MATSIPSPITAFPSSLRRHNHRHNYRHRQSFLPSPSLRSLSPRPLHHCPRRSLAHSRRPPRAVSQDLDFSGSFFESDDDDDDSSEIVSSSWGPSARLLSSEIAMEEEEKETPPCPPGLRQYESMVVLLPDLPEKDRLAFIQKYEELLVAGGGMYVEIFNRGVIPLAFPIKKLNKDGEAFVYDEGIYLLFSYFTKPESMNVLESSLCTDYSVIRFTNFKVEKTKWD